MNVATMPATWGRAAETTVALDTALSGDEQPNPRIVAVATTRALQQLSQLARGHTITSND